MHICPGCGKQTKGSFRAGGVIMADCPGCKLEKLLELRKQLNYDIKILRQELAEDKQQDS